MKRIGIVPVSKGAGAGFVAAMLATELAAITGAGGAVTVNAPGGITVVELGRGNLFDQLCADRWFRVRQMVSYWNCLHGEGQIERIRNPYCGVNWLLRTPEDKGNLIDCSTTERSTEETTKETGNDWPEYTLERGRAVKLLYSLPGDVAFVDFSAMKEADMLYLLEDMDQLVAVVDPMPSKLLEGYEMIHRLKICKKPVVWTVNRWTDQIEGKELRKILGNERRMVAIPEVPRGFLYQGEYAGVGMIEHQQIRRLMAPGMEEIIKRLML